MSPAEFEALRKAMGYSQEDAAKALGVSRGTVNTMERGADPIAPAYAAAIEHAALFVAIQNGKTEIVPAALRAEALAFAKLVEAGAAKEEADKLVSTAVGLRFAEANTPKPDDGTLTGLAVDALQLCSGQRRSPRS